MMPRRLTLPLLAALLPTAQAALQEVPTPWYPAASEAGRRLADREQSGNAELDAALQALGGTGHADSNTSADAPAPGEQEGDSVVTCDNGLFFDTSNPDVVRLVYLDNVRLTDSRLQLHALHRLYLQLSQDKEEAEEEPKGAPQAAPDKAAPPPQPTEETPLPTPPAPPTPPSDEAVSAPHEPAPQQPLVVTAYDAMVDMDGNRMLFAGGPGVEVLSFVQGENQLHVNSTADQPARVLADEAGNLLVEGPVIRMHWRDEQGQPGWLEAKGGRAFYHGESHSLVLEGPVTMEQTPGSRVETDGRLCINFRMAEGAEPATSGKNSFMAQFTALRFEGIAAASTQRGQRVLLADEARGMSAYGNILLYNGTTGEVEIEGAPCVLGYAANELRTDGRLELAEDGSITLRGDDIRGEYERPSRYTKDGTVRGTLSAEGELRFHADNGTVTTTALCARDDEADFSCVGPVELTLAPLPEEEQRTQSPREKMGMLNLAITRYGEVSAVRASGRVRAHGYRPGQKDNPDSSLAASELDANLQTGEMLLIGSSEPASISYDGYALSGTATETASARVQLLPNGDIEAQGARIDAAIPGQKGLTKLNCTEQATLRRETRELTLGPRSHITSPEGIITANGPLTAILAPGDKPARSASQRYPQLSYNFSGLESASTQQGATVRAEQGSLQCTRQLTITMENSARGKENKFGGIRDALAVGRVAVAARDSQGRLMRAKGDRLTVNGRTGEKILTGSTVVLEDENNRHTASGGNARIRIDAQNNAVITGAQHKTTAQSIRQQVEERKNQQQKKQ